MSQQAVIWRPRHSDLTTTGNMAIGTAEILIATDVSGWSGWVIAGGLTRLIGLGCDLTTQSFHSSGRSISNIQYKIFSVFPILKFTIGILVKIQEGSLSLQRRTD